VLALLIFLLLLPLTLVRPKAGAILLVFLLAFMPRYVGLGVSEAGFALTPRRVAVITTAIALAGVYLVRPGIFAGLPALMRENRNLLVLLLLIFGTKLVATLVNSGISLNVSYVLDDLLLALVPAVAVLVVVRSSRDEELLVMALVAGVILSAFLAGLESWRGQVLLQGLVDVSVTEVGVGGLSDNIRGEAYRAKALFDNPLLLAEFVCLIWPWALYLLMAGQSSFARLLGLTAFVLSPLTIYLTQTRSGWLVFASGIGIFLALRLWDKSGRIARAPIAVLYGAIIVGAVLVLYQLALNSADYLASGAVGSRSIAERLNQYVVVAAAWVDSPFIGYGMMRNFAYDLEFLNNFDNYWLRLVLEGGAVLLLLFLAFVVRLVSLILQARAYAPTREYRVFMTAALASVAGFCLYKMFLSMPTNNAYFFIVAALVVRRTYLYEKTVTNAHIALPQ